MAIGNHGNLVIEMTSLLQNADTTITADCCCIYRVPYNIRRLNEDSYTPKVVSIGHFHYGHPKLQNMQRYKLLYLKKFCQRISICNITMERLINFVEEIEPSVRLHYSEPIELSNKQLAKVILLDACFLFELFLRFSEQTDSTEFKPWLNNTIRVDLLLLENQLPFPELQRLFIGIFPSSVTNDGTNPSFLRLSLLYFAHYCPNDEELDGGTICHFTDLLRKFYRPSFSSQRARFRVKHVPCATELAEAGLTFRKGTSLHLLDLKFSGVLKIPELNVDDSTETLLRNLVMLEQCHYPDEPYIIDYVAIMDFLINTSADVDLLVRQGVIINWLGDSNSVANLFNSLCKNVIHADFNSHYSDICKDLNAFYKSPWNHLKATLRHDYCKTPWQTAASVAGIFLLLLSLIQAATSILQVAQQHKTSS